MASRTSKNFRVKAMDQLRIHEAEMSERVNELKKMYSNIHQKRKFFSSDCFTFKKRLRPGESLGDWGQPQENRPRFLLGSEIQEC